MSSRFSLKKMATKAKQACTFIAKASTSQKNQALRNIAEGLKVHQDEVLKINQEDIDEAKAAKLEESMIERLSLKNRIEGIIADIHQVIDLPDPVGELFDKTTKNNLTIVKSRTPLGVLGIIYESRPNVTVDVATLTIKSGNCAILRGGSETLKTNQFLAKIIQAALHKAGLPKEVMQLVPSSERGLVKKMLHLHEYIDLIIPRGGAALHQFCRENSTIPVITGGIGICHLFVDATADLQKSLEVSINAKVQRPTVCNALDTLLVHKDVAATFIPMAIERFIGLKVVCKLDEQAWDALDDKLRALCQRAQPSDWDVEWLSLILGIKVVSGLDEAIKHISEHSTGHSDGILTNDKANGDRFVKEVDSAAVYVNASTRFTDGSQFGLGAEVAISTQKVHARGPMALRELTSYKWIVQGHYSIRG